MEWYQMEPILSLTSLTLSPYSYGRPSKEKRPPIFSPRTIYDGAFVQDTMPLEDEDENKAITT